MSRVRWPIPSHDPNVLGRLRTTPFQITKSKTIDEVVTNQTKLFDIFQRTVVDGFGTSDSGHVWVIGGSETSAVDVNGDRGTINLTSAGQDVIATVQIPCNTLTGLFRWSFSAAPSGNLNRIMFALLNASSQNKYLFRIENNNGNNIRPDIYYENTLLGNYEFDLGATGDEMYCRFYRIDSEMGMKFWKVGDSEPGAYQIVVRHEAGDNLTQLSFRAERHSTNAPTFTIDEVEIYSAPASINRLTSESISESVVNVGTADTTLLSAEAQALNNSGSGSFVVADATAETVTQVNNPGYGEGVYGGGPYGSPDYISILEALADSSTNEATSNQVILSAEAQDINNSGSGSFVTADATAETINNSATADITLEETIVVPAVVIPTIIKIKAHSYPELVPVTRSIGAFTVSAFEIAETITNEATSVQLILSAEAQAANNSGSGSFTVADATSETISNNASSTQTLAEALADTIINSQTSAQSILEAIAEFVNNFATSIQTILEASAETNTNAGTSVITILSAEAQDANNSGSGSFTTADATAETVNNSATGSISILELIAIVDDLVSSATAVISILSAEAQNVNNSGSGSFETADATAETISNSAESVISILENIAGTVIETVDNVSTSDITILSAEAQAANSDGTGSFTVADATAETTLNSAIALQTIEEALAESLVSSATNVHSLLSSDLEALVNSGTASHTDAESIAESMSSFATALHSMLENGTIRLFPDEDISTGTWHDTPLWPKIDEMNAVGGYPTEAIISGEDPIDDTAVLGLQPGSDPQMDIDHFINVQFYKIGGPADEIDFIIKLKQGASVIATRTFVDVQETEGAPRTERIGLTTGEVANITNYGDLRFEIIANKTN